MARAPTARRAGLPAALAGILFVSASALPLRADDGDAEGQDRKAVASLEDRLTLGLKARRPEDVAWLERVATMVREGRLPAKVVDSTYLWAQRRRQAYPYPSFRRALELQADRLGIEID